MYMSCFKFFMHWNSAVEHFLMDLRRSINTLLPLPLLLPLPTRCRVSILLFIFLFVCLFGWFLNVLVNNWAISWTGPKTERLTILRAATHETELGDHDFCLSQSHYTDTDPTSRGRAATAEIEPGTSSPGVARSTDWATLFVWLVS